MRFSLYRNLLIVTCLLVIFTACGGKEESKPKTESTEKPLSSIPRDTPIPGNIGTTPTPSANTTSSTSTTTSTTTSTNPSTESVIAKGLRSVDLKIASKLALPITEDKIKDAFPTEPYKVNFIREGSDKSWSRIKIDLNRNDKWDEKWDLADGKLLKRQVSSKDDENYDQTFIWKDSKWEAVK